MKYDKVEKQIHKQIDRLTDLRIRQNREFFNIAPDVAIDIMRDIADLLDDAELAVYVDGKPVISRSREEDKEIKAKNDDNAKRKERKQPFKFHMIGLKVGDVVTFDELKLEVKVASDDKVEYQDRLYSLSSFTENFLPDEKQTPSRAYPGPKYFSYNGKTLYELRNEKEEK